MGVMPLESAFYIGNTDPLRAIYSAYFHSVWTSYLCRRIMKYMTSQDTFNSDTIGHARMNLSIPNTVLVFFMGTAVAVLILLKDSV